MLAASSGGKIEIESLDEVARARCSTTSSRAPCSRCSRPRGARADHDILTAFEEGVIVHTGEDIASGELAGLVESVPALRAPVAALDRG